MMQDIYGWRAKLGLIYPSSSWVMEPEFYAMSPSGVITCTTRVLLEDCSVAGLQKMGMQVVDSAKLLAGSEADAIVLGCTSGSFVNGIEYNNDLIKRMEDASGRPCTTTTSSLIAALEALNIQKVAIATPYVPEVNQRAKAYFEKCGIEVTHIEGLGYIYDTDIHGQSLEKNFAYAKKVDRMEVNAVLILCTAMRSIPIIEALEADLGKPVLSAIQSSFWHTLRLAGVQEKINGFGSLLQH
jgi:maleate isomerase